MESIWRQKSRELWLYYGNCNAEFFHAFATIKRRSNLIGSLKDDDGAWILSNDKIGVFLLCKFIDLFRSSQLTLSPKLEFFFHQVVFKHDNNILYGIPIVSEILKDN